MCGIFGYIGSGIIDNNKLNELSTESYKLNNRGPDDRGVFFKKNIYLSFFRLAINDLSENGNQPLWSNDSKITLICNGEIYNWKILKENNNYNLSSESDCEIIIHLYKQYGFHKTIEMLDGVFACILIDWSDSEPIIHVARDPIGVRPLFIGNKNKDVMFASEMKSIDKLADKIEQFPPGSIWCNKNNEYIKYYNPDIIYSYTNTPDAVVKVDDILCSIKTHFINAVDKRLMSERPIGCLLSGGLDSSLVAALLSKKIKNLRTFSIGLKGATDLIYAKKVADHIDSVHTEIIVTEEEMLEAIEPTIYQIESYDTTTVRASTPMFLLSKYIKNNTDITVVYSGEGSDEASGSYLYFRNAPNSEQFFKETVRLMKDLSYYDVLRCDRTTAGHSLEVRVPFLDKDFLQYYMNIDPKLKIPSAYNGTEKYLLRKAFDYENLLPHDILWRTKEAFSDGVSSNEKSWYSIINQYVDNKYSSYELNCLKIKYNLNSESLSESIYFRDIFEKYYPNRSELIPYYWLPKWSGDTTNPSARVLKIY